MQETKTPRDPKKSLWASYAIIFVVVLLFNALLLPSFARMGVQQVDYGTFLQMLEGGELTTVQLDDTEILFFRHRKPAVFDQRHRPGPGHRQPAGSRGRQV